MTDEPKLLAEPREGVPNVIDTLPAFRDYCSELASSHGSLAADATRIRLPAMGYGGRGWLQFKRDGAGIGLLDPQALAAAGVDWNDFNRAVGDAYGFCMIPCRIFRDSTNSAWTATLSTRKSPRVCWD